MTAATGTLLLVVAAAALVVAVARPRIAFALPLATTALWLGVSLLAWALVTQDYQLRYVAESARRGAPAPFRLAGLWGGMAGSLLFFAAMAAGWTAVAAWLVRGAGPLLTAGVRRMGAAVTAVFVVPLLTVVRPFETLAFAPLDGVGLVPVLEHPAMLYHPPLLYLGLTALAAPALLAAASWWTDVRVARVEDLVYRLTAMAVVVLGAGMVAGARWAYLEAGWGGLWAWDPIENAALLPWLVAVAALHERARWRRALVVTAFVLAVAGTVLTRSGATVSVHAFAEAGAVGWMLLSGLAAVIAAMAVKAIARRRLTMTSSAAGPVGRPSPVVMVLGAAAAVIAIGTFAPAIVGIVLDRPGVAAPSFFSRFAGPPLLLAALVALIAALRRPRPAAVAAAHAGVALLAVGAIGSVFGESATAVITPGPAVRVAGRNISIHGVAARTVAGRTELVADLMVDGSKMRPAIREGRDGGRPTSESALRSKTTRDVLVVPRRISSARGSAVIDVHVRPLVGLVWAGSGLCLAGAALTLAGRRRGRPACDPVAAQGSEEVRARLAPGVRQGEVAPEVEVAAPRPETVEVTPSAAASEPAPGPRGSPLSSTRSTP